MLSQLLATSVTYGYEPDVATGIGILMGVFAIIMIPVLIIVIVTIIGMWKLFEKAGRPGWNAIVPFYNSYVLTEISGQNGLLFLLCFVPGVGAIAWQVIVAIKLAPAFGKSTGFAIGLILLAPIFYCILGFGKDPYLLDNAANAQSPFDAQPAQGAQPAAPEATQGEDTTQTPPAQA